MQLFRFVRFVILKMYTVVMASKFVFWSVGHVFEYCSRWVFFFFLTFHVDCHADPAYKCVPDSYWASS